MISKIHYLVNSIKVMSKSINNISYSIAQETSRPSTPKTESPTRPTAPRKTDTTSKPTAPRKSN